MLGYVSLAKISRGEITALFPEELPVQLAGSVKGRKVLVNHVPVDRFTLLTKTVGVDREAVVTVYVSDTTRSDNGVVGYVDFNLAKGKYEVYVLKPYRNQNIEIEIDATFKEST